MSARPRFSVVVPAHNEADTLPAALASLAAQRCPAPYEVIVVDNASTDATATVAARAGATVVGRAAARGLPGSPDRRRRRSRRDRGLDRRRHHPARGLAGPDRRDLPGARCRRYAGGRGGRPMPLRRPALVGGNHPAALVRRHRGARQAGRGVRYITATNVAFVRDRFPGYDVSLHQGGDEMDLLRTLRRLGSVVWDRELIVDTSSRRMRRDCRTPSWCPTATTTSANASGAACSAGPPSPRRRPSGPWTRRGRRAAAGAGAEQR